MESDLTLYEGLILQRLAGNTIATHLGLPVVSEKGDDEHPLRSPRLAEKRGVFVTLKQDGALRGCIGTLVGEIPLVEGVRVYALKAAFEDYRFSPLTAAEFPRTSVEVSVLSTPRPLDYLDGEDLVAKLSPGKDGVLLEKARQGATFLPQVWEQLPKPEHFLEHLCLKAGLPPTAWQDGELEVKTYRVQVFGH